MRDRVCLALPPLKGQYLLPDKLSELSDTVWQETKTEYGTLMPNQDNADAELELWRQAKDKDSQICQVLKDMLDFLPNVHTVLKVLLTIPVSTTSAEQNFSTLSYLKIYLRSTVLDTRLTGHVLMNGPHRNQHRH